MLLQLFVLAVVLSSSFADKCPEIPPGQAGICVEECSDSDACPGNQMCCSTGCGHVCMNPVKDDDDDDDEECTGGQVWRECGSPCTATCDNQNSVCATVCEKRCQCPTNAPIWHNGVCIVNTMCPGYTGECDLSLGLVHSNCSSVCVSTCENPTPVCTKQCAMRCHCGVNSRWEGGMCIPWRMCPNEKRKCLLGKPMPDVFCGRGIDREDCPDGYYCGIAPDDGYAVCCPGPEGMMCPMASEISVCATTCQNTTECPEGQKCCQAACGRTCVTPLKDDDDDSDEDDDDDEGMCKVGEPLEGMFCGQGGSQCPDTHTCKIHESDAVCCPKIQGEGCHFDALSKDAREALDSVKDGDSAPESLIEYLPEVFRAGCLKRLSNKFKKQTCTKAVFKNAVCKVHHIDLIKGFLKCLPDAEKCAAITEIFQTDKAACIRDGDLALVAELFVSGGCQVPVAAVLLLSEPVMVRFLDSLTGDQLKQFVTTSVEHPEWFQLLSCFKKRKFVSSLANKVGLTPVNPQLLPYLPYLPKDTCQGIIILLGSQLIPNLGGLLQMPFECDESDNIFSHLQSSLKQTGMTLESYLLAMHAASIMPTGSPPINFMLDQDIVTSCPAIATCGQTIFQGLMSIFSNLGMTTNLGGVCQTLKHTLQTLKQCLGGDVICAAGVQSQVQVLIDWVHNMCTLTFKDRILLTLYKQNRGNSKCKFECGRIVAEKVVELLEQNNTRVDLTNANETLGSLARCIDLKELIDNIQPGNCAEIQAEVITDIEIQERRELAAKCWVLKANHEYTDAELTSQGCILLFQKPSLLRKLSKEQLCRVIGTILLHCLQDQNIIRNINPSVREHLEKTCNNIDAIVNKVKQQRLQDKRDDTAEQNKADAEAEMKMGNKNKARALLFMAAQKLNATDITTDKDIAKTIPSSKLRQLVKKENLEVTDIEVSGTNSQQRKSLVKLYLSITKQTFEDLGEEELEKLTALSRGLNNKDLSMICDDKPATCILTIFQKLADDLPFKGKAVKKIYTWLKQWMDSETKPTAAEIERLTPEALRHLTLEDLQVLAEDVRQAIVKKLAMDKNRQCGEQTDQERMDQGKFALDLAGGAKTSEEDIEIAEVLTDADPDEISFREDFLNNGGPVKMAACPFCLRPKMANKIISSLQDLTKVNYESLVCWLPTLLTSDLSQEKRNMTLEAIWDHQDDIKAAMMCSRDSEVMCRLSSLDADGMAMVDKIKAKVRQGLKEAAEKDQEEDAGESRKKRELTHRTRREVTMYLCQTLRGMDSDTLVEVLTTEHIQDMDDDEFLDCLSTLGSVSGWSDSQARTMFTKALVVLDTTACNLTDSTLSELRTLAYALTMAEITCLDIDLDMLTTLGQLSMWSEQQLTALASRYLDFNDLNPATDFTAETLVALGHILCGLEDAQIRAIPPEEYWSASSVVGDLETAPVPCLRALLSVATHENAHGPLTDWTSVTYSDVGALLGGLTGEQLKSADDDDFTGFQDNGIKLIPVEELNKLSLSDFEQLSRAQLLQLTAEQREGLNSELQDGMTCLLEECEEEDDDDDDDGGDNGVITGVAGLTVSLCTLVCAYISTLFVL